MKIGQVYENKYQTSPKSEVKKKTFNRAKLDYSLYKQNCPISPNYFNPSFGKRTGESRKRRDEEVRAIYSEKYIPTNEVWSYKKILEVLKTVSTEYDKTYSKKGEVTIEDLNGILKDVLPSKMFEKVEFKDFSEYENRGKNAKSAVHDVGHKVEIYLITQLEYFNDRVKELLLDMLGYCKDISPYLDTIKYELDKLPSNKKITTEDINSIINNVVPKTIAKPEIEFEDAEGLSNGRFYRDKNNQVKTIAINKRNEFQHEYKLIVLHELKHALSVVATNKSIFDYKLEAKNIAVKTIENIWSKSEGNMFDKIRFDKIGSRSSYNPEKSTLSDLLLCMDLTDEKELTDFIGKTIKDAVYEEMGSEETGKKILKSRAFWENMACCARDEKEAYNTAKMTKDNPRKEPSKIVVILYLELEKFCKQKAKETK